MNILPKKQRGLIYQQLPSELKEVFVADETTQILISLGDKHDLKQEDRGVLGEAVGLVLLGILGRKEFQEYLYQEMDQEKSIVDSIVKETRTIFQPIAGQLEKVNPEEILKRAREQEREENSGDIPVPPPPGGAGTPSPSYGGTSDPYREPPE